MPSQDRDAQPGPRCAARTGMRGQDRFVSGLDAGTAKKSPDPWQAGAS
jgi:hypothetical protein